MMCNKFLDLTFELECEMILMLIINLKDGIHLITVCWLFSAYVKSLVWPIHILAPYCKHCS